MNIAIVGGGPSGLRAAEVACSSGDTVTLFEGKASVGRKLLVAGKGGLFHAAIITGNRVLKRRIKIGDSDRAS